jgi:hypothetical protein
MSGPRNQHWLPQFYLRRFAVPGYRDKKNAKIWVMDVETGDLTTKKVKEVAASDFLYSHLKPDGSRCFKVEKQLAKMETMIARLYPRIADGIPDLSTAWGIKKLTALFIVSLILRHPDSEAVTKDTHQKLVNLIEKAPKDERGLPQINHVYRDGQQFPFDTSDYESYKTADDNQMKEMFANQIRPIAAQLSEELFKKRWIFLCCDLPIFFSSDKPVIQQHTGIKKFGVGTPGVNLWFPVSPFRMLWMKDGDGQPDGFYPFPEAEAVGLNAFTMSNATRFLLSHEHPDARMQDVSRLADQVKNGVW